MMRLMLSFFWFSALVVLAGPPSWPAAPGPERRRPRLTLNTSGNHDFAGEVRRVGKIPWHVREYGRPALAVRADGAMVRGFAWRGSMEGVNVGSHPFTPRAQRERHRAIRVTLDHLWCDDIGEDAVSIQPRAVVTIRQSHFRGNHGRLHTGDSNVRGLDKILQIDSATVILEDCVFYDAVSAVRAKTNSRVILKNIGRCARGMQGARSKFYERSRGAGAYASGCTEVARVYVRVFLCTDAECVCTHGRVRPLFF